LGQSALAAGTREIFHTLHRCTEDEQRTPDFGNVLTALDDPAMKNIWVEIDERAQAKAPEAQEDARQRLQGLIADYRYALEKRNRPTWRRHCKRRRLNEEEELYVLQMLIAQERSIGMVFPDPRKGRMREPSRGTRDPAEPRDAHGIP
jgi:hypothetical protein